MGIWYVRRSSLSLRTVWACLLVLLLLHHLGHHLTVCHITIGYVHTQLILLHAIRHMLRCHSRPGSWCCLHHIHISLLFGNLFVACNHLLLCYNSILLVNLLLWHILIREHCRSGLKVRHRVWISIHSRGHATSHHRRSTLRYMRTVRSRHPWMHPRRHTLTLHGAHRWTSTVHWSRSTHRVTWSHTWGDHMVLRESSHDRGFSGDVAKDILCRHSRSVNKKDCMSQSLTVLTRL